MSRTRAKAEISIERMQKDMEGICTTSVCQGTIDEAPDAYKDTDSIKHQIDGTTVKIDCIWKPVINIKAAS
jgi:RNA-splicing ligase RtcB